MRLDNKTWPSALNGGPNGGAGHTIRVLIAHADAIVSAGLRALLAPCADIELMPDGAPHPGMTANIVITDHRGGIAHMRSCADQHQAHAHALIVTQLDREWEVRTAMTAGVQGYLLQSCAPDQLLTAVRTLGRGLRYLSPELSRCVADSFTRAGLTGRETDVLQLLAQGQCNKTIARELGIGVGTVKTHVKGLFDKLGATARTHAVVLATRRGLIGEMQRDGAGQY
jgi:two-component system NarL family response regulator